MFASRLGLASLAIALLAAPASAAPLQRFTLIVGANAGGGDRPQLQYAVSDAERFARVLVDLGGVSPADELVLKQPRLRELVDALDLLHKRVADARRVGGPGARIEVLVYYSGHADEQGLLLGGDRYSYRTLRDRLDEIPADVRIAILDACASGAFTRLKGGRARPPFLVDESAAMRGHAFLTSSAATEAAQESDRIRASYFTHYLISGFRGAADLSGDGRVTLNEAYQFAFNETLRRTVDTNGGAQHPSYDINLSGTGDVVMTDVRQTGATIVLADDVEGRFFIRNAAHELVVELYKPRGRMVELGVEPGAYEIRVEQATGALIAKTQVADGGRTLLAARQFGATAVETTRQRGGTEPARSAIAGRHRIDARTGMWRVGDGGASVSVGAGSFDTLVGLQYMHYVRENLAISIGVQGVPLVNGVSVRPAIVFSGNASLVALPFGIRWTPAKWASAGAVRPYISGAVGPAIGITNGVFTGSGTVVIGSNSQSTIFTQIGGGLDYFPARSLAIGVGGGYNRLGSFAEPVGAAINHSGPELNISIGWMFGHGRPLHASRTR